MKKEHCQQQADEHEVLLKEVKSVKEQHREAGADVPEDVTQSENVDERGQMSPVSHPRGPGRRTGPYACTVELQSPS